MIRLNNDMHRLARRFNESVRLQNRSLSSTFSSKTITDDDDDDASVKAPTKTQQPKRRNRRRQFPKEDNESIPSLADFMHRAKVRQQYRHFVRLAHFVDGNNTPAAGQEGKPSTGECRAALEEVRLAYKIGIKKGIDDLSKTMAFNEGERQLRQLEAMVGYSRKSTSSDSMEEGYEADSWINIKDDEDKRGRVGVSWPWESNDGT